MKTVIAIAIVGLLSVGSAAITPAAAFHLSPPGDFTADGQTSATKSGLTLPCNAHFTGTVDSKGLGQVTGGTFTDNGSVGCTAVTLQNLPWKAKAVSATKVKLYNVTFHTPIGDCGPSNVPVKVKNGVLKFTTVAIAGGCTISGKLKTSPKLAIVP